MDRHHNRDAYVEDWLARLFAADALPDWTWDADTGSYYEHDAKPRPRLHLDTEGDLVGSLAHEALHHAFVLARSGRLTGDGEEAFTETLLLLVEREAQRAVLSELATV